MAYSTFYTWRFRRYTNAQFWNSSLTYYDADGFPISVDNSEPRPVPRYVHKIAVDMKIPENLVWLISSNKDQAMLMLHQQRQGMNHKL